MSEEQVFTSPSDADLIVRPHPEFPGESVVSLEIDKDYAWEAEDIKALRKFLKKLQKQLEAQEAME